MAALLSVPTAAASGPPDHLEGVFGDLSVGAHAVGKRSIYVPMDDGNRLAVDLYLPTSHRQGERFPAIVEMTRYWRDHQLIGLMEDEDRMNRQAVFFARRGYAVLLVDVRGTGASFGSRPGPHSPREVQDGCELARWIASQPWSSGKIGAFGDSYSGTSAALLATCNDPNIAVVIPRFYEWDVYTDIAYPGGIFHRSFVETWAAGNDALDRNKTPKSIFGALGAAAVAGVAPVDGRDGKKLLRQAVEQHHRNVDVFELARRAEFRDRSEPAGGPSMDSFSLHSRGDRLKTSPTVIYAWGSWLDAGTARSVIAQAMNLENPFFGIIGPWNHGADHHASPYQPEPIRPTPTQSDQRAGFLRVFDRYLKGDGTEEPDIPRLTYYTLGEERWKTTDEWPPAGFEHQKLYLGPERALRSSASPGPGSDTYEVDFSATTGTRNRWFTQHGDTDVVYGNRADLPHRLLSYVSEPLTEPKELTGHPTLTLSLSSTTSDNALYVYLEDVAPDGIVRYVTDGQLRSAARQIDERPPYALPVDRPSYREADARPIVPGERTEIAVPLLPTSVVLQTGHRLRLSIAGHDADSFERIPAEGPSTLEVFWQGSSLDLPLKSRPDLTRDTEPLPLDHYAGRYRFADGGIVRIRADQGFLRMGGENPAGTQRLVGDFEGNDAVEAKAQALIAALRNKRRSEAEKRVAENFKELWKLRKALRKSTYAGSTPWAGDTMTVFEMESREGRHSLMLLWDPNLQVTAWGTSLSLPAEGRYLQRTAERFEGMDPRPVAELEFEIDGHKVAAVKIGGERAERAP